MTLAFAVHESANGFVKQNILRQEPVWQGNAPQIGIRHREVVCQK